jgi:hypothetical protein
LFTDAASITLVARDWLANSRYPRILHIFDRACNLINERREVLSIVGPQIGNGPFNLVLENNVFFPEHLNFQSQVSRSVNQLTLGDLSIHTADAKLWVPRPDWESLHTKKNEFLNQIISLQATLSDAGGKPGNPSHSDIASYQLPISNLRSLLGDYYRRPFFGTKNSIQTFRFRCRSHSRR